MKKIYIKLSFFFLLWFFHPYNRPFFFCMCFSLQQVACLQAQLMHLKAQLANNTGNLENQWQGNVSGAPSFQNFPGYMNSVSPQCSLESIDHNSDGMAMQDIQSRDEFSFQTCSRKRPPHNDLGELQELALRMMRNWWSSSSCPSFLFLISLDEFGPCPNGICK